MTGRLLERRITLAVTGSIAAYKAVLVARLLLKEGARVGVMMTASAQQFVGASTFSGITGEPVQTTMFDARGGEKHVSLAAESDLLLVVPATADTLSHLAAGCADDLLSATVLCARCPVLVVPAMHPNMWTHPSTTRNVATLIADGRVEVLGPGYGEVASGEIGPGRMLEPEEVVSRVVKRLSPGDLAERKLIITAGPTVEDLDPVRFVSNRSSGKMGFALAESAAMRGADVTLVAGPVTLATPARVNRIDVRSALEMRAEVKRALGKDLAGIDALLMCAAVGDFRPATAHPTKIKRRQNAAFTLNLVQNPDILSEIGAARRGSAPVLIGFALETGDDAEIVELARDKLRAKRVDLVVANPASESMGRDDNRVMIVDKEKAEALDAMSKREVAERVLDWLVSRLASTRVSKRAGGRRRAAGPGVARAKSKR